MDPISKLWCSQYFHYLLISFARLAWASYPRHNVPITVVNKHKDKQLIITYLANSAEPPSPRRAPSSDSTQVISAVPAVFGNIICLVPEQENDAHIEPGSNGEDAGGEDK